MVESTPTTTRRCVLQQLCGGGRIISDSISSFDPPNVFDPAEDNRFVETGAIGVKSDAEDSGSDDLKTQG
jgi:hypothetical protein